MDLKRTIERITFNYYATVESDIDWFTYEVGIRNVTKITEPKFDSGKQCCLVYFKDGTMSKVYNVSEIFYETEEEGSEC